MKLHRLAMIRLHPGPRYMRRWTWRYDGKPDVRVLGFQGPEDLGDGPDPAQGLSFGVRRAGELPPAEILLAASVAFRLPPGSRPSISPSDTRDAERALAERVNLLGIAAQASQETVSPRPYIFLEAETEEDRLALAEAEAIELPRLRLGAARLAPGVHRIDVDFTTMLADRPQGVTLMAAALAAGRGIAQLHELMRVFENAFAVAGARLVDPLTAFLRSHQWQLGYSRGEVNRWIRELRDPATHADLSRARTVLLDSDVQPYLARIEQAAYDVLFNKEHWHRSDSARLNRWGFASMINREGVSVVSEGGALGGFEELDHMRAFRLDERYQIEPESAPADWVPVDWYSVGSSE